MPGLRGAENRWFYGFLAYDALVTVHGSDHRSGGDTGMAEESERTRRALLTGGAVLLGGAVLANEGTAEAADGHSFLLGRSNKASHSTALTGTGTAAALSVTSTRSAAIKAAANKGNQPAVAAYN